MLVRKVREDAHSQKKSKWWHQKGKKGFRPKSFSDTAIRPERLRLAFEELGPTFVKLGQVLSTRVDLLSELVGQEEALTWITEFQKLQRQAQPF